MSNAPKGINLGDSIDYRYLQPNNLTLEWSDSYNCTVFGCYTLDVDDHYRFENTTCHVTGNYSNGKHIVSYIRCVDDRLSVCDN